MAVEVADALLEAEQGLLQRDLEVDEQIVIDTLEARVGPLLHGEDEVTLDHVWDLFCLALKHHLIPILHSLLYLNGQRFLVVDNLVSLAMSAVGGIYVASAAAPVARSLHLHLHHTHLHSLQDYSLTIALGALLDLAVFGACASALGAVHITGDSHVSAGAKIQLLKAYVDISLSGGALLTVVASALHSLKSFLALLVVHLALIWV